jgi:hypothetical protein
VSKFLTFVRSLLIFLRFYNGSRIGVPRDNPLKSTRAPASGNLQKACMGIVILEPLYSGTRARFTPILANQLRMWTK